MANFLSGFLDNLGSGLSRPKGNLGDFAHASRLFTDSRMRLAPKTKFLYHVVHISFSVHVDQPTDKDHNNKMVPVLLRVRHDILVLDILVDCCIELVHKTTVTGVGLKSRSLYIVLSKIVFLRTIPIDVPHTHVRNQRIKLVCNREGFFK